MARVSYELTMARADHSAAEKRWKDHRLGCTTCSTASHSRKSLPCGYGHELLEDRREAAARLRREQELERAPVPGQEPLFTDADLEI